MGGGGRDSLIERTWLVKLIPAVDSPSYLIMYRLDIVIAFYWAFQLIS